MKIDQLDREYNVKVLAINEPLNIDVSAPDTFLNRAFKLLLANNELLKIRERTRRGIRLAMESGRVVNNAPFGYKNQRDEYNRPILMADPNRAPIITQMYVDFLSRLPDKQIISDARKRGFTLKGKSALTRVLSNPVYAGLIKVPAFFNTPEKIVHALHSPLISEAIYWRVQELLTGRVKLRGSPKEEIPLRGLVRCSCGSSLTAAFSKGRTKYYLYYRCVREGKPNYPGEALHGLFNRILNHLFFTESQRIAITYSFKEKLEASFNVQKLVITDNKRAIIEIDRKVEKLEECLLNEQIEPSSYKKWYLKLKDQKSVLQQELNTSLNEYLLIQHNLEKEMPRLINAKDVIENCNFSSKQKFLRIIFEAGLVYDGKVFRAPYIHPAFVYLCNELEEKKLFILENDTIDPYTD